MKIRESGKQVTQAVMTAVVTPAVVLMGCDDMIDSAEDRAKDTANVAVNDTLNDSVGGVLNTSVMNGAADVLAYVVLYDENSTADTWIELVEYERP